MKKVDDYYILQSLGSGLSSQVYLCLDKMTGQKLALKCYKPDQDQVQREYQILLTLQNHPNIIRVHDYKSMPKKTKQTFIRKTKASMMKKSSSYLVLEYADRGDLLSFIKRNQYLDDKITRNIFKQLLNTLEYIHHKGYVHFDIKPDNILLNENFEIKIADFGLAQNRFQRFQFNKIGGTQQYLPPDFFSSQIIEYNDEIDMFGSAITFFLMKMGRNPFRIADPLSDKLYCYISKKKYNKFWEFHQRLNKKIYIDNDFKDLFQRMVAFDKSERISIQVIREHQWMRGPIATLQDFKQLM